MMHILCISVIFDRTALFDIFQHNSFRWLAKSKNEKNLILFRKRHLFLKGSSLDRSNHATSDTLFGSTKQNALSGDSVVATSAGADSGIAEDYDVGGRAFSFSRTVPIFQISSPRKTRIYLRVIFGRVVDKILQRLDIAAAGRQTPKVNKFQQCFARYCLVLFESPSSDWAAAWKVGKWMVEYLGVDPRI